MFDVSKEYYKNEELSPIYGMGKAPRILQVRDYSFLIIFLNVTVKQPREQSM